MAKIENSKKTFGTNKDSLGGILKDIMQSFLMSEEFYSKLAIVKSVDLENATVSVQIVDGDLLEDVRLQQVQNDAGLLIVPAIDSPVLIAWTDKTTAYISLTSQIENIVFQGGNFGGLIKISELTEKLNSLVNNIKVNYQAIKTGITAAGGAYTPVNPDDFDKEDFENENFKH